MSSPTAAAAAANEGLRNLSNEGPYRSGDPLLPTIIEETKKGSKKNGYQKAKTGNSTTVLIDQQRFENCDHDDHEKKLLYDSWADDKKCLDKEEEEDVHLMARTLAASQTAGKRASTTHGQQRWQQNNQNCLTSSSSDNRHLDTNDDPDDDGDDDDDHTDRRSSSSPSTDEYDHYQHAISSRTFEGNSGNSSLLSSIVAQRVLSTLIKPLHKISSRALHQVAKKSATRSRRNRRTQTDQAHYHSLLHSCNSLNSHPKVSHSRGEMKRKSHQSQQQQQQQQQYTRLFQAPNLVSFSRDSDGRLSDGRFLLCTKLLIRQLRLPLAILAFVFLFVIQFRANQQPNLPPKHSSSITGGGNPFQLRQPAASDNVANTVAANSSLTYLNASSSLKAAAAAAFTARNASSSDSVKAATTSAGNPIPAKSALIRDVAAPAGSNVLVNRDLQAMPASSGAAPAGSAAAQVDASEAVITASSSLISSNSTLVNNINPIDSSVTISNNTYKVPIKPPCPLIPPKLVGRLKVLRKAPPMTELETLLADVQVGGRYSPPECTPKYRVAIIVPYRDRDEHLRAFLYNIHPMLMRQNIEYGIFIVEQSGSDRFNRAKLMNVGFLEARNHLDYDCFIFHDVDLIPEDDRNLYTCPEQPRHMSVAIDKFRYRLPYKDLFGGVSALTREQFETVNGFSNEFWGWGGEDDDMSNRVRHHKFKISRYKPEIARYTMLKHQQDAPSAERYKKLYNGWRRYDSDGINSTTYTVLDTTFKKLYTWILVDIFPPPMAKKKVEPKRSKLSMHSSRLFRPQYRYFSRRPL